MRKNRRVYLSIDLDYWRFTQTNAGCTRFFRQVFACELPVFVALHHHHLLRDINARVDDLDAVLNVDFHSDLVDNLPDCFGPTPLNEGTWANHVAFRHRGNFEWRYPSKVCLKCGVGYCHDSKNPFQPRKSRQVCGWKSATHQQHLRKIPWEQIAAIGVCISPTWMPHGFRYVEFPMNALGAWGWVGRNSRYDHCTGRFFFDEHQPANGVGNYEPYLTYPKSVL